MFTYAQASGQFVMTAQGYSGFGPDKNRPEFEQVHDMGPIPDGLWHIAEIPPSEESGPHGPYVLHLIPDPSTEVYGRSGFLIHGDSKEHPGQASKGCIILPRWVREMIWNSGQRTILVVAKERS